MVWRQRNEKEIAKNWKFIRWCQDSLEDIDAKFQGYGFLAEEDILKKNYLEKKLALAKKERRILTGLPF